MRFRFIDAAKGASIVLVVLWPAEGRHFPPNEPLTFLRMPLFFFVSGFFAVGAMRLAWGEFLTKKVGNLLYLFVIWTALLYLGTDFLREIAFGKSLSWQSRLDLFVDPPRTLWFIYALAIVFLVARLARDLPAVPVFGAAMFLYCLSLWLEPLHGAPFPHRVIRGLPFFLIAVRWGSGIRAAVPVLRGHSWTLLFLFCALATALHGSSLVRFGPAVFLVGICGIAAILGIMHRCEHSWPVQALAFAGQRSFYIYVMHRLPLVIIGLAAITFEIDAPFVTGTLAILLAIAGPLFLGERVIREYMPFLEKAPWLLFSERRRRLGPASDASLAGPQSGSDRLAGQGRQPPLRGSLRPRLSTTGREERCPRRPS